MNLKTAIPGCFLNSHLFHQMDLFQRSFFLLSFFKVIINSTLITYIECAIKERFLRANEKENIVEYKITVIQLDYKILIVLSLDVSDIIRYANKNILIFLCLFVIKFESKFPNAGIKTIRSSNLRKKRERESG